MSVAQVWAVALFLLVFNQDVHFGFAVSPSLSPSPPGKPLFTPRKSNVTSTPSRKQSPPPPASTVTAPNTSYPPPSPAYPSPDSIPSFPPPAPLTGSNLLGVSPDFTQTGTAQGQGQGTKGEAALSDGAIAGIAIGAAALVAIVVGVIAYLRKRGVACKGEAPYSVAEPGMKPRNRKEAKQAATCFAAGFTPMEAKEATAQLRTDVHSAVQAMELHLAGQLSDLSLKPPLLAPNVTGAIMFQRYSLYHQCFLWLHHRLWSQEADFRRWPLFPVAVQVGGKGDDTKNDPNIQQMLQNAVTEEHYANYLTSVREGVEDPESETEAAITQVAQAMLQDLRAPAGCLEAVKRLVRQAVITRLLIGAINKSSALQVPGCRPAEDIWTIPFEEILHSVHMEFNAGNDVNGQGKQVLFCYEPGYSVGKGGELLQRPAMVIVVSPEQDQGIGAVP